MYHERGLSAARFADQPNQLFLRVSNLVDALFHQRLPPYKLLTSAVYKGPVQPHDVGLFIQDCILQSYQHLHTCTHARVEATLFCHTEQQ